MHAERQDGSDSLETNEADLFDIAVDNEITNNTRQRSSRDSRSGRNGSHVANPKRQSKNEKYGFGGKKRHSKSGDALSSGDLSGFSVKKMKAGRARTKLTKSPRLGKSKRMAHGPK